MTGGLSANKKAGLKFGAGLVKGVGGLAGIDLPDVDVEALSSVAGSLTSGCPHGKAGRASRPGAQQAKAKGKAKGKGKGKGTGKLLS